MSPEAVAAERIYRLLKKQVVEGDFRPGSTVRLGGVATAFGTSISPVRDALHRLIGERLVGGLPGGGFFIPEVDIDQLRHLYLWHGEIARLAAKGDLKSDQMEERIAVADLGPQEHAKATGEFFRTLGASCGNPEYFYALDAAADRLHFIRLHEESLGRCGSELATLWRVARSGNKRSMRIALWHYHRRRILNVQIILRGMQSDRFV